MPVGAIARIGSSIARVSPFTLLRIGFAALICAAVVAPLAADPDLYGHLRFGLDTLYSGTLRAADPYSFTSDRPWVNHEWLAEVGTALAWLAGGVVGLALLKTLVLAGALIIVRRRIAPGPTGDLLWIGALVALAPVLPTFRPQTWSILLCAWVLDSLHRRRSRWIELPLAMAIWANMHGGWLVGIGLIGVWVAADVIRRRAPVRDLALPLLSAAATLVNPHGAGLWSFLWKTVGLGRPDISEWRPLTDQPGLLLLWIGLSVVVVLSWRRTRAWTALAASLLMAVASTRVGRLVPFYGLTVVMGFGARWPASPQPSVSPGQRRFGVLLGGGLSIAALALGIWNMRGAPLASNFALDRQAAGALRAVRPAGKMVVFFDWGQYAIWHWGPELQVSYDGRRETVYSSRVIAANNAIYAGSPEGLSYLDALDADWIWMPSALKVVADLRQDPGWRLWLETPVSVVFARPGAAPAPDAPAVPASFP